MNSNMNRKWLTRAASNIALIKYMGRKDEQMKIPENASLSYTLQNLSSFVELEVSSESTSRWEPLLTLPMDDIEELKEQKLMPITLSLKAQERFLKHLMFIQEFLGHNGSFIVRSANTFPQASGLASSASSFAGLTLCSVLAISELMDKPAPSVDVIVGLSRQGSGSSCRSFYEPWALWDNEMVTPMEEKDLPYPHLIHQVIMISRDEKKVLSSEAHRQVQTSPLYHGRAERAEKRLKDLLIGFKAKNWADAYKITWDEFQDMHELFETAAPAFSYRTEATYGLLNQLKNFWDKNGDGPLITMDAGPNIHLLYRPDQTDMVEKITHDYLKGYEHVLSP